MQDSRERQKVAVNIWTARAIPVVLAGIVGYATYVLVALLCVNYLLVEHNDKSAAIPILIVYFILLMLMAASFFRLLHITWFDPPYVPLGPAAISKSKGPRRRKITNGSKSDEIGGEEYHLESRNGVKPDLKDDPDSPGLELFYTKDMFIADMDGKPRWCSYCLNWKPDRSHHCSSSSRCIKKMDHFCPWVGGPVGESNYKFFIQFNGYTALYCLHLLVSVAVYTSRQHRTEGESIDRNFTAILGLAGFFGLFTLGMFTTTLDLAMKNLTQVENLGAKTRIYTLAIIKPPGPILDSIDVVKAKQSNYPTISYPLPNGGVVGQRHQFSHNGILPEAEVSTHVEPAGPLTDPAVDWDGTNHRIAMSKVSNIPPMSNASQGTTDAHPIEGLTARDRGAVREFAVLRSPAPGQNPWDLCSRSLNLQTVMGYGFLDWVMPFKRSPCCNHENSESQFSFGPWVDLIRSETGFIAKEDARPVPKSRVKVVSERRRRRRRSVKDVSTEHASTDDGVVNSEA